ncbi:hypothetical protein HK099_007062 [Clydaea vesicula]|uniref:Uncharacterized protein n=1 Tax=Clydaea vesicula TaxID=447962 RepID=A0AAD5TXC6_9FUNG|nr:hypothetical protein HK099_007062 [Clydaea vesicula]
MVMDNYDIKPSKPFCVLELGSKNKQEEIVEKYKDLVSNLNFDSDWYNYPEEKIISELLTDFENLKNCFELMNPRKITELSTRICLSSKDCHKNKWMIVRLAKKYPSFNVEQVLLFHMEIAEKCNPEEHTSILLSSIQQQMLRVEENITQSIKKSSESLSSNILDTGNNISQSITDVKEIGGTVLKAVESNDKTLLSSLTTTENNLSQLIRNSNTITDAHLGSFSSKLIATENIILQNLKTDLSQLCSSVQKVDHNITLTSFDI